MDTGINSDCSGIEPCFHSVVAKWGREAFLVCWHANMAGEAASRLLAQAEKRQSKEILHAAGVMSQAFNEVVEMLGKAHGWTPEHLAEVDRDSQLAWRESVREAETPKIWLQ